MSSKFSHALPILAYLSVYTLKVNFILFCYWHGPYLWFLLSFDGRMCSIYARLYSPCSLLMRACQDGKLVCTGGEDGTVRVWAPKTGACKHVYEGAIFTNRHTFVHLGIA